MAKKKGDISKDRTLDAKAIRPLLPSAPGNQIAAGP